MTSTRDKTGNWTFERHGSKNWAILTSKLELYHGLKLVNTMVRLHHRKMSANPYNILLGYELNLQWNVGINRCNKEFQLLVYCSDVCTNADDNKLGRVQIPYMYTGQPSGP